MRRRQSGFSMCLLSGLLLLCLACLEIPEMSALNDDVSNDFTILTTDLSGSLVVVQVRVTHIEAGGRPAVLAVALRSSAVELTSGRAPRDLLSLYSLWRT